MADFHRSLVRGVANALTALGDADGAATKPLLRALAAQLDTALAAGDSDAAAWDQVIAKKYGGARKTKSADDLHGWEKVLSELGKQR